MTDPAATLDGELVLAVERLSKRYLGTSALSEVDLSVRKHEIHALIGGNGSGKSTLIKILAGVVAADPGGTIVTASRAVSAARWTPRDARAVHLRFVHQDLGLFGDLSVADNLCIGAGYQTAGGRIRWQTVRKRCHALLRRHGVEVDPRRPLASLSLAEQTMVAIVRALQDVDDDASACVILDEPTAALPVRDAEQLLGMLRGLADSGHGVVLVTHHIDEVLSTADTVTVLRDGRHIHTGSAAELDRGQIIDMIVGRTGSHVEPALRGETAAAPERLRASVPTSSISLVGHRGEILGLTGLLGSGFDDVLKTLFGLSSSAAGTVSVDGEDIDCGSPSAAMRGGIAYLPADRLRDGIFAELTVLENVTAASTTAHGRVRLRHRSEARTAQRLIQSFRVRPPQLRRAIQTLSGGNQQKVLLARWAARNPRVLLLEEPTRGVDVGARSEIWSLLRDKARDEGISIVIASSDVEELAWYCDRVLVFGNGLIAEELSGDELEPSHITHAIYEASRVTVTTHG